MATDWEIVRTKQNPPNLPPDHARIVEVETRGGTRFPVESVAKWIDAGTDTFWVRHPDTGARSDVTTYTLPAGKRHIRTERNRSTKDNLDSLPTYE